jgi:hypothetical protein
MNPDQAWLIESSRDGEKWRTMGKAWTFAGEPLLVHGASKFLRFRHVDHEDWVGPMERTGNECMALVDLDAGTRVEIWPGDEHRGLPVFLPGGEAGRLVAFACSDDQHSWTYTLEFRGEHPESLR